MDSTKGQRLRKKGETNPHLRNALCLLTLRYSSLRDRKNAILKLFDIIGLRPQAGAAVKGKKSTVPIRAPKDAPPRVVKKATEIVGDGEEIEVEDAEELSKNDIDTIYSK